MAIQFSKKSMESLEEPDKLDTYIRVATPGAWMILGGVALVIVALGIWVMLGDVNGESIINALFG